MRIDVHAHYYPDALYELLERIVGNRAPGRLASCAASPTTCPSTA